MFSMLNADFSKGVYSGGKINGFQAYVMQSSIYTDALIKEFKYYISKGHNPNEIYDEVFKLVKCSESDLTDMDKSRLKKQIEEEYKRWHRLYM